MITYDGVHNTIDGVVSVNSTLFGLSTDTKPTGAAVANGSCFLELDSSKIYFYDADNAQWREWGA